ncbi:hypothetical protein ACO22_00586 [Paracoccidioides brasiliensis]|uniref:Uncharacterized protein n=1 Tax=Paracoccidioides brasiliensis TaxID=121759 RepID=A0A1D2JNX4_PARBR|nr:hypothetical protein ACO22_00586 [Paracoccidioides brasiliensis]
MYVMWKVRWAYAHVIKHLIRKMRPVQSSCLENWPDLSSAEGKEAKWVVWLRRPTPQADDDGLGTIKHPLVIQSTFGEI